MRYICKTVLLQAALSVLLTGCWSRIELNDRTFMAGIFVDKADNPGEIELTVTTPLPNRLSSGAQSGGGNEKSIPFAAVTKSAKTLPDALQLIQTDLTRQISWGLNRVIVVGRRLAETGLNELIEWISRQPAFHLRTYILVAPGNAKEMTKLTPVYERSPSEVLKEFASQRTVLTTTVRDVMDAAVGQKDIAISMLTIRTGPMVSEQSKDSHWAGTDGAAVIRDNKMVGQLTKDEAYMIAWVRGTLREPVFTVPLDDRQGQSISVRMFKMKADVVPTFAKASIRYRIRLAGQSIIVNFNSKRDLNEPAAFHDIEKQISQYINRLLNQMLMKTQKLETDVLHLGNYVEWRKPKRWQTLQADWHSYFAQHVTFETSADIRIEYYGSRNNAFQQKER